MNELNVDQLLDAWMDLGPGTAPARVADAARLEARSTRQTAIPPWWPPRRFLEMNNMMRLGLVAAAFAAAALLGYSYFVAPNVGGPGIENASPTPSPKALPASGELAPGSYLMDDPGWTRWPLTLSVPEGWSTGEGWITKGEDVFLVTYLVTHVYVDACHPGQNWVSTPTSDEIASALANQAGHETAGPTADSIGGFPAQRIDIRVPADFDVQASCDGNPRLRLWPDPGPNDGGGVSIPAGQVMSIFVVDVGEQPMVVATGYRSNTPDSVVAELDEIRSSLRFTESDAR